MGARVLLRYLVHDGRVGFARGPARWLMLTAPVSPATVLGAKVAVNLAIAVQRLAVSAVLMAVSLLTPCRSAVRGAALRPACWRHVWDWRLTRAARSTTGWTSVYEPVARRSGVRRDHDRHGVLRPGMGVTTLLGVASLAGASGGRGLRRGVPRRGEAGPRARNRSRRRGGRMCETIIACAIAASVARANTTRKRKGEGVRMVIRHRSGRKNRCTCRYAARSSRPSPRASWYRHGVAIRSRAG